MRRASLVFGVRLFALLLLFAGVSLNWISVRPSVAISAALPALDEDKDESGQGKKDEEDKEDRKEDKDEEKEDKKENKKDKDKDKDDDEDEGTISVDAAAPYTVDVTCESNDRGTETTCTFIGRAPEGAKDVGHVDLPESEICTDVIGGDAEYVNPDPNTKVIGYKSRGSEAQFTLELTGSVTTGGTATYWFKTGDGVFPARGPGLVCEDQEPDPGPTSTPTPSAFGLTPLATKPVSEQPTATGTAGPTDSEGVIHVAVYDCPIAEAVSDYDWFGSCASASNGIRFRIAATSTDATDQLTGATDESGQVQFGTLAPGAYALTSVDTAWCRAESDGVDAKGQVIVRAGERTTVWIFRCSEDTSK